MERKHSILSRWLPTDKEYKDIEYTVLFTKQEQLLVQMWKTGQRRLFLIELKRKYAGLFRGELKFVKSLAIQVDVIYWCIIILLLQMVKR